MQVPPSPGPAPKPKVKTTSGPKSSKPFKLCQIQRPNYDAENLDIKPLRLVLISDTHNHAESIKLPPGDILIHAGDFTNSGTIEEVEKFKTWLEQQIFEHKIVIPGNHEVSPEIPKKALKNSCTYLSNDSCTIQGLKFYGTAWKSDFSKIPKKTDILITHVPPVGFGSVGSPILVSEIQNRVRPLLHIAGHNHEGYGSYFDGTTTYLNAATCMGGPKSVHRRKPLVVDVYPKSKKENKVT